MGMPLGYWGAPLGCRFHPTDQELVASYLRVRALAGKPLGIPFIYEYNLFGQTPPWVVWENFGGNSLLDQDLFFFYELRSSGSRSKRQIEAGGTWSGTSSDKVLGLDGNQIGEKRHFKYTNKGSENNGDWLLEEYSLLPSAVAGAKVVLSRLKRNPRSRCGNRMDSSVPTPEFNEKPPVKRAGKQVLNEKPPVKRKRARTEELNEKPSVKKEKKEVGSQTNTSASVVAIGELQDCPSTSSSPDEGNRMISETANDDQECISNIHGNVKMTDFSVHDYVPLMSDVYSDPICLGGEYGATTSDEEILLHAEEFLLGFDQWLGTVEGESPQEHPQIDECSQPSDGIRYWTDCLWMSDSVNDQ
ncbi:hypothetical protein ACFX2I_031666 [Malus domestica]|uniref:NAC domain-containing protein 41-like n=1 Tax=Malus domestica TaxID=3750 RepID=UPI00397486B2